MSNGSNIRKTKPTSKCFIVDYRNAKYQGEISEYDRLPNGMGILMTINYQFIVANWDEGNVNGQYLCVNPEGNIFYGTIRNNQLTGFSTYQLSKQKYIYSVITQEPQCWFFVDFQMTNTLLALRVPTQQVNQLLSNEHSSAKRGQQIMTNYIDSTLKKNNQIVQEYLYQNQEDKWSNIGKLTGKTIGNQHKNMKAFLKYHFNVHAPNRDCRLEITQTSEFTELRYKKAGIVCRIDDNAANQNQVKFLGYYDSYEEHSDVYRKTASSFQAEVQQYCEGHALTYHKERPPICKKNLQNHFRKSVHFVNHFISLEVFRGVKNIYSELFLEVEDEMSTKYAQIQLQKGLEQKPVGEKAEGQARQPMTEKFKKIELNSIKNDIYNKVKKRKNSPSIDKDASFPSKHPFEKSVVSNYYFNKQPKENHQNVRGFERRYLEDPTPKRTMEYLRYAQQSPVGKIRHSKSNKREESNEHAARRKYSYIPTEESQVDDFAADRALQRSVSNTFLDKNKNNNGQSEQKEENLYNLRYQNKPRALKSHIESISSLTNNYERIKVQLSQEKKLNSKREQERPVSPSYNASTPSNRSPSRLSHLKYPMHSPSGTGGRRRQWR